MLLRFLIAGHLIAMAILSAAEPNILTADHAALIAETHANSLKLREASLRKTIAKDTVWPNGVWGENLWTLSALYLNEKTDTANARIAPTAATKSSSTSVLSNEPSISPHKNNTHHKSHPSATSDHLQGSSA